MEIRKGSIYLARCLVNEKGYVGQTIQDPEQRIKDHLKTIDNTIFHNAIQKHKPENFVWCWIRYKDVPEYLLNDLEQFFIELFKTIYPFGYNMTTGGSINNMVIPEVRAKISGDNHYSKTNPEAWERNQQAIRKTYTDPKRNEKLSKNCSMKKPEVAAKISGDNHYSKTNPEAWERNQQAVRKTYNDPERNRKISESQSGDNHYSKKPGFISPLKGRSKTEKHIQNFKISLSKTLERKSKESGQVWLI